MSNSVVIVIDMQEDYLRQEGLVPLRRQLVEHINRLVKASRDRQRPIIWVVSEFAADLSDASLEMRRDKISVVVEGTEGARLLEELDVSPGDRCIVKKRYSAFFRTDLAPLLEELAADRVILAGVNTHACVRTTAIDAYQRDIEVVIPRECVASYDREHHEISLRYMSGKIAHIVSLEDID